MAEKRMVFHKRAAEFSTFWQETEAQPDQVAVTETMERFCYITISVLKFLL